MAGCHLYDHNMRWSILPVRHTGLLLGKVTWSGMTKPRMSLFELEFALYDLLQTVMNSEHWPCFASCPYFPAWLCCWCSCREPSCTASGGGGWVMTRKTSGSSLLSSGEGEVEMEVETCLPCLPHHSHILQGRRASGKQEFNPHPFIFQAALFLNPSSMMMGVNIRMTACEATLESLLQLSLQLFIIFLRSNTMPSLLQVGWWEQRG